MIRQDRGHGEERGWIAEAVTFLKRHWWHLPLLAPGAILVTALHEAAHAAAVWAQGGQVERFVFLPNEHGWGYVSYRFPLGADYSNRLISLAPALGCLLVLAVAGILCARRRSWSHRNASLVFFWLYVLPLAEIAHAAFPFLAGGNNDFAHALGSPSLGAWLAIGALTLTGTGAGYLVQARLYEESRLTPRTYTILSAVALLVVLGITVGLKL